MRSGAGSPPPHPCRHRWSRPRVREELLGRVHACGQSPRTLCLAFQVETERRQGPNVLQVDRPLAPLAAKGSRPRGGTLVTRPRPEHSCRQRSTLVSLQPTAHMTAVVALHVCRDPHRSILASLVSRPHVAGELGSPAVPSSPGRSALPDNANQAVMPHRSHLCSTAEDLPRMGSRSKKKRRHLGWVPPPDLRIAALASRASPWARIPGLPIPRRSGWAGRCGCRRSARASGPPSPPYGEWRKPG